MIKHNYEFIKAPKTSHI